MLKSETSKLLTLAATVDPLALTPMMVEVWHEIIGHLTYKEARAALKAHRETSTEIVKPAHIIAQVRQARADAHGIQVGVAYHPPAPAGKRWAVDVIEGLDDLELRS